LLTVYLLQLSYYYCICNHDNLCGLMFAWECIVLQAKHSWGREHQVNIGNICVLSDVARICNIDHVAHIMTSPSDVLLFLSSWRPGK